MNSYLRKSIIGVIVATAMGVSLSEAHASSTTTLDTVEATWSYYDFGYVSSTYWWTIDDYDIWDDNYAYSPSGGGAGQGGGAGGGTSMSCELLRATKPDNCPNPIPYPEGYSYGRDVAASGSALGKALYWIEYMRPSNNARNVMINALEKHTADIASRVVSWEQANRDLLSGISRACQEQHDDPYDRASRQVRGGITNEESKCLEVLQRMVFEANDDTFIQWFGQWLRTNGLELSDLGLPATIAISLFDPANSLRQKYDAGTRDAKCSEWWTNVQTNNCPT